jgi:hypothetical protein
MVMLKIQLVLSLHIICVQIGIVTKKNYRNTKGEKSGKHISVDQPVLHNRISNAIIRA